MKRIADLAGQHLEWVQPSALKMEYELRAGSAVAATLGFRSSFGSLTSGRSADGSWTFKRVGFFETRATIRAEGAEADLAVFRNNTWSQGGTLQLPDGRKYPATTNLWATGFDLNDDSGNMLIGHRVRGLLRSPEWPRSVDVDPRRPTRRHTRQRTSIIRRRSAPHGVTSS